MAGSKIDKQSPLGLFLRLSVMGHSFDFFHQEKEAVERFERKMREEFGSERFGREKLKYYGDLQN